MHLSTTGGVRIAAPRRGTVEIAVDGDVDLTTLAPLREALDLALDLHPGSVVVDLSDTGFLSCRAAAVLAEAGSMLAGRGRGLEVRGAHPALARSLRICGLGGHFPAPPPDDHLTKPADPCPGTPRDGRQSAGRSAEGR